MQKIFKITAIASPIIFLILFFYFPVAFIIVQGFVSNGTLSIQPIIDALSRPLDQAAIIFTFQEATISTIITIILSIPGAYVLAKFDFKGKSLSRAVLMVPFVLPSIVVVVGFVRMFGSEGYINMVLKLIFGANFPTFDLASGFLGIVLAHVFYNIPIAILMISAVWERIDTDIEDAAEVLGSSGWHKFKKIVFPLTAPGFISAALLIFLFCFMSFTIVLALGGPYFRTIEVQIWASFLNFDYDRASALAIIQLFLTIVVTIVYLRTNEIYSKRVQTKAKSIKKRLISPDSGLSRKKAVALIGYVAFLVILLTGPLVSVFLTSFFDPYTNSFTLQGYERMLTWATHPNLGIPALLPVVNSLFYAIVSTTASVLIGILGAFLTKDSFKKISKIYHVMILAPLGISAITLALGLSLVWGKIGVFANSPWILIVLAHTLIELPFTTRAIANQIDQMDNEVINASETLGASKLETFFRVELPIIAPGIFVAATLAFAMSIGEMSATYFLAKPQYITMTIVIYQLLGARKFVDAGALSSILILICIFAFYIIEKLSRGEFGGNF